ncbi:CPBP family intramembrane glutamic endopeptidase [Paenibacillus sonchi]|uniref:CPBP family intramembrane glutamic endopeptidase n=1 Tax=Paenibacillus sonchi TaxID=373687 RepID=UPI001E51D2C6|nr:CPBP family intramembrane glutamic endopeptidase [Paenibacillus sonchi]MCE3202670.1 CPBP family intramembrane metalloprotease [Paenibacillus sonchi]
MLEDEAPLQRCTSRLRKDVIERVREAGRILQQRMEQPPSLLELSGLAGISDSKLKFGFRAKAGRYRGWSVMINVALFVVYHFFFPWMIITRLIAIFPVYFIVWRTKNIYTGIVAHVLLNLISGLSLYSLYFR